MISLRALDERPRVRILGSSAQRPQAYLIPEPLPQHQRELLGELGRESQRITERGDDGRVTLQSVECLCACEHAPMMQVDDRYEFDLNPEKVDRILARLR